MSKKQITALVLIGICAIIMIITKGKTEVDLALTTIKPLSSLVFLSFTGIGVVIGILIK